MNLVNAEHLVTEVKPYDFVNKDTGERITGVNLFYYDLETIGFDPRIKGCQLLKIGISDKILGQLSVVPGYYNLNIRSRAGKDSKSVPLIIGADFVAAADLRCMFVSEVAAR